jgi:hypothetical protein
VTELRRLLDSTDDEIERALLDAVRAERPRAAGLRDTALALGLTTSTANALASTLPAGSGLGTAFGVEATSGVLPLGSSAGVASTGVIASSATGAATTLGPASLGVLGKSLIGGTLLSFVALTTLDQTVGISSNDASTSLTASAALPPRPPVPPARQTPGPSRVPPTAATASPAATDAREPSVATPPRLVADQRRSLAARVPKFAPVAPATPSDGVPGGAAFAPVSQPAPSASAAASASLTEEIRLLDRARAALAAGDTVTAGRLLDAYASNRPSSVLVQEAALLRVKVLLARGERSAAVELARRIIATYPESAHVDTLRRLAAQL